MMLRQLQNSMRKLNFDWSYVMCIMVHIYIIVVDLRVRIQSADPHTQVYILCQPKQAKHILKIQQSKVPTNKASKSLSYDKIYRSHWKYYYCQHVR